MSDRLTAAQEQEIREVVARPGPYSVVTFTRKEIRGLLTELDTLRTALEKAREERDAARADLTSTQEQHAILDDERVANLRGELTTQYTRADRAEDLYRAATERLQLACKRFGLGLGGERVDELVIDALAALQATIQRLPTTADGVPIVPGMTVYCLVGRHVDERDVIGPYGQKALLTREPAQHGAGEGSCHRLAETVYADRQCAEAALAAPALPPQEPGR